MLIPDMLEGLLRQTVVQWGTEQGVVVLQEDKQLGVAECTQLGVVECTQLGVAEGRMWDRRLEFAEDSTGG